MKVAKATPALKVAVSPQTVRVDRTRPSVTVKLSAPGHTVHGKVVVRSGGRQYVATLTDGVATVKLAAATAAPGPAGAGHLPRQHHRQGGLHDRPVRVRR